MKFYKCKHCKQIVTKLNDKGIPLVCCGEVMQELVPNTTDAANEKHVPVVEVNGRDVKVTVGSVIHPMVEEHYIEWIVLETTNNVYWAKLKPNQAPVATFTLQEGEEVVNAYEHCNLHSLWAAK